MSKSTKEKPYKGTKRDQYTIVLEGIRSDFRVFGDGIQSLNQKFDHLDHKVESLDRKVEVIGSDVYILKNQVSILDKKVDKIDGRLNQLETKTVSRKEFQDHEDRIAILESNS